MHGEKYRARDKARETFRRLLKADFAQKRAPVLRTDVVRKKRVMLRYIVRLRRRLANEELRHRAEVTGEVAFDGGERRVVPLRRRWRTELDMREIHNGCLERRACTQRAARRQLQRVV